MSEGDRPGGDQNHPPRNHVYEEINYNTGYETPVRHNNSIPPDVPSTPRPLRHYPDQTRSNSDVNNNKNTEVQSPHPALPSPYITRIHARPWDVPVNLTLPSPDIQQVHSPPSTRSPPSLTYSTPYDPFLTQKTKQVASRSPFSRRKSHEDHASNEPCPDVAGEWFHRRKDKSIQLGEVPSHPDGNLLPKAPDSCASSRMDRDGYLLPQSSVSSERSKQAVDQRQVQSRHRAGVTPDRDSLGKVTPDRDSAGEVTPDRDSAAYLHPHSPGPVCGPAPYQSLRDPIGAAPRPLYCTAFAAEVTDIGEF